MSHTDRAIEPSELWQNGREPVFWLNPELRMGWVNHAWEDLTGHSSTSVVGNHLSLPRADPVDDPPTGIEFSPSA